jgi:hypothetical protein
MTAVWNLYRFDYYRFLQLRPQLRTAVDADEFAAIDAGPGADAIVEALIERELDGIQARQAMLIACCCVGDPMPCPRHLPAVLKRLLQHAQAEAGADLLIDAIAGARNMESWLQPRGQLVGFLTPDETRSVLDAYVLADASARLARRKSHRPARHGGVLHVLLTFLRRAFDRDLPAEELYRLLGELLEEAVSHGNGIAVVSV